jgi:CarD family transcriptional regulator, regulator of rRNA transcription
MFAIGQSLFHPAHGITEVQAVTSMNLYGEQKQFYVLRSIYTSSQFFVPIDNADKVGLRKTIRAKEAESLMAAMNEEIQSEELPWRERHRRNLEKLSTGQPNLIAEVVRDLSSQDKEKRLPATSQRLLDRARQMLVEEIAFVMRRTLEDVDRELRVAVA